MTYFKIKVSFPWVRYKPSDEAIKEAKEVFKSSAREAGEEMTDLQAEQAVTRVLKDSKATKRYLEWINHLMLYFEVPRFFCKPNYT